MGVASLPKILRADINHPRRTPAESATPAPPRVPGGSAATEASRRCPAAGVGGSHSRQTGAAGEQANTAATWSRAVLDEASTWGSARTGRTGKRLPQATAARHARPGAPRGCLCGVCGGYYITLPGWGEDPASQRPGSKRRQPEPRRPRSAAVLRRRRTQIGEYKCSGV